MIPKIIHQIWLGNPSNRPIEAMESWKAVYPDWKYMLWTEENMPNLQNQKQFDSVTDYPGKADILRYEILKEYGGFYADADTLAKERIPESFLEYPCFCAYENEKARPGLVANTFLASQKEGLVIQKLIDKIHTYSSKYLSKSTRPPSWQILGPLLLTEILKETSSEECVVFPSHYFLPVHCTGVTYEGTDKSYAEHFWGSTGSARQFHREIY